jgi:hypothetical protein
MIDDNFNVKLIEFNCNPCLMLGKKIKILINFLLTNF